MPLSTLKKLMSPFAAQNITAGVTHDITWDRPLFRPPTLPNPRVMFDPQPFTAQRPPLKRTAGADRKSSTTPTREEEPKGLRRWLFAPNRQRPLHGQGQFV